MIFLRASLASLACLLLATLPQASPLAPRAESTTATGTAAAAPSTTVVFEWAHGGTTKYPIQHSCNSTLRTQLQHGLDELAVPARHARDHILRWGDEFPFVQKYFGSNHSTAEPLGRYERIVAGDKTGMTFRCDDPDLNCAHTGSNATLETVICPLFFATRRPVSAICNLGYTVASSPLKLFWDTDLLHRVLHVPKISERAVGHWTEEYADVLELVKDDPEHSARDIHVLQYFTTDVYALDIAAPGVGCTGEPAEKENTAPTEAVVAQPSATMAASKIS